MHITQIEISAQGGPEMLQVADAELPPPGASEIQIDQSAIGINYIDVYFRTGLYPAPQMPFTPGMEGAGTILEQQDYQLTDPIGSGALVETDLDGDTLFYLLAPAGGGTTLDFLGCELTVLTPEAPLFQQLAGRKAGDMLEDPPLLLLGVE